MKKLPRPKAPPTPEQKNKMAKQARTKAKKDDAREVKEALGRNPDDPWLSPDNDALFHDMGEI